jgi:hypothetical protein
MDRGDEGTTHCPLIGGMRAPLTVPWIEGTRVPDAVPWIEDIRPLDAAPWTEGIRPPDAFNSHENTVHIHTYFSTTFMVAEISERE